MLSERSSEAGKGRLNRCPTMRGGGREGEGRESCVAELADYSLRRKDAHLRKRQSTSPFICAAATECVEKNV